MLTSWILTGHLVVVELDLIPVRQDLPYWWRSWFWWQVSSPLLWLVFSDTGSLSWGGLIACLFCHILLHPWGGDLTYVWVLGVLLWVWNPVPFSPKRALKYLPYRGTMPSLAAHLRIGNIREYHPPRSPPLVSSKQSLFEGFCRESPTSQDLPICIFLGNVEVW